MQVQLVCLEVGIPGLLNAIVEESKHASDRFLQDPDIMVVYLEQLVIPPPPLIPLLICRHLFHL